MVVPTLRRQHTLRRVLDCLERQDVPPDAFEAVVAADAEEADRAGLARLTRGRPYQVRVTSGSVAGASAARNSGWREARAPLILFLDDDVLPEESLVKEHLAWHRRHPQAEVGVLGYVGWARELKVTPFMRWLDRGLQFGYGSIEGVEAGWTRFYTANVSLKRTMLERSGGFDEVSFPFGYEDIDLARRLEGLGFRLLYNKQAKAQHLHAATLDEWRRTVARIAPAERRFARRYPDVRPYYLKVLTRETDSLRALELGAALAGVIPPGVPWLGPRVWTRAAATYRRELAPPFLRAWASADLAEAGRAAPPSGSGRPEGG